MLIEKGGLDGLTGLSVQRERWFTESSQRTRGSDFMDFHLIEEYMVSSLRRNCLISFLNMRNEAVENVIYDIKKIKHLQMKILKNNVPEWRPMTDFVHRTIILERFRKSQYKIMIDLILTMR